MFKFLTNWLANRKISDQKKICQIEGHWLEKNGEGREGELIQGVPIPMKPVSLWIMTCKCGYGELDEPGTLPHRVSWADGQEKLRKAKNGK